MLAVSGSVDRPPFDKIGGSRFGRERERAIRALAEDEKQANACFSQSLPALFKKFFAEECGIFQAIAALGFPPL